MPIFVLVIKHNLLSKLFSISISVRSRKLLKSIFLFFTSHSTLLIFNLFHSLFFFVINCLALHHSNASLLSLSLSTTSQKPWLTAATTAKNHIPILFKSHTRIHTENHSH